VNVLFLTPSYPTEDDPVAGVFVREHALAAAAHADVTVLHLARGRASRVREVPGEPLPTWQVGYPNRPAAAGLLAAAAAGLRRLPARDLVHAHFFLAGAPAALLSRKPLVVSEHWSVFLPEDPLGLSPPLRAAARLAFGRAGAVLPVSRALERGILEVAPRARTSVVPNVVDTDLFHPGGEPEPGRLLAVGLFYEAKGFDILLKALPDVPGARLDLVGDGELRPELELRARGLPVTFHGRLPKPAVSELMRRAQLLVLPSRFETSAVVGLEALASGLPVVGTRVGAIPELLDDDGTGELAEPGRLAEAIRRALDRDFDRPAIAARARARYGREAVGRQLAEIYGSLVK
jgi:glycosyltransferase involved in cell wall biosynthesis